MVSTLSLRTPALAVLSLMAIRSTDGLGLANDEARMGASTAAADAMRIFAPFSVILSAAKDLLLARGESGSFASLRMTFELLLHALPVDVHVDVVVDANTGLPVCRTDLRLRQRAHRLVVQQE